MAMVAAQRPHCYIAGFDLWIRDYAGMPNPGEEFVRGELARVGYAGSAEFFVGDSRETVPRYVREHPDRYFDLITVDCDHSRAGARVDELAALYRGADLFVLPNIALDNGDCEGCPIVLIEASAWGKPVIAGREGGTSTAVDDGVTGLLVDPRRPGELAAAIERVLTDGGFAARLGRAGRCKVSRDHDPVTNSRAFYNVLRDAVCSG